MSKMKSMLGLSLMMASLAMINHNNSPKIKDEYLPKESEEQKNKRLKKISDKINKGRGLTEYFYGSVSIWALNQKSADKKAKKQNLI